MDANALRIQRMNARSRYQRLLTLLGLIEFRKMTLRSSDWIRQDDRAWAVKQALTETGQQL